MEEDYPEAKRTARRAVYNAKRVAKLERFGDVLRREDDRAQLSKIAKQMTATNTDIVCEKCIRNDKGDLAASDMGKTWLGKSIARVCYMRNLSGKRRT